MTTWHGSHALRLAEEVPRSSTSCSAAWLALASAPASGGGTRVGATLPPAPTCTEPHLQLRMTSVSSSPSP